MAKNYAEEFQKRKEKICAEEKVTIEEGPVYQEALKENRYDRHWYPAGELATVTFENGVTVTLEIEGSVKGELLDSNGTIYGQFKGVVDEIDDILVTDKHLKTFLSGEDDMYIDLTDDNRVIASSDAGIVTLDDNIAKALFNVSAYRHLSEKQEQASIDDIKPSEEPAAENDPAPDGDGTAKAVEETAEAVESEPAEEPVDVEEPEEEPAPESEPDPKPAPKAKKSTRKKKDQDTNLEDSGFREKFESGAVRDRRNDPDNPKGRCDLTPKVMMRRFFDAQPVKTFLDYIEEFENTGDEEALVNAAKAFANKVFPDDYTAMLEWSIHMENGANKYGDRNWEKGIPLYCYVDSATRHYLKYMRGDDDERHDRAVLWNCLCGAWTAVHHPDLNQYPL